jgi:hypothetical protein
LPVEASANTSRFAALSQTRKSRYLTTEEEPKAVQFLNQFSLMLWLDSPLIEPD